MAEDPFDRNLKRLLGAVPPPEEATPRFREELLRRLEDEAARMRGAGRDGTEMPAARPAAWHPPAWTIAAAAAILVVAAGLGIDRLLGKKPSGEPVTVAQWAPAEARGTLSVSADRPVVIEVPRGAMGSVSLVRRGLEIARLELKDGAEVEVSPGASPVLALKGGVVRVEADRGLSLAAGPVALAVDAGADVEVEFVQSGDGAMMKSWLVPGGIGAAAGAAAVAIVLHRGNVEVTAPESRPAEIAIEKPLVVELPATRPVVPDDRDKRLAQAERKIADLEKKLAASKKESDKLAADLVQKKGVTLDSIAARLAELRKGTGMNVMLGTADLIADIKGLGPAGVQALLDLLKSEDPKDRFIAAKLLEDLKDPAAIPALRDVALNDADPKAARMAGHALALMGDPRAADALREIAAKKRSDADQINSLWGLVNLGDQQGFEQAMAFMDDKDIPAGSRGLLGVNVAMLMTDRPDVMPIVDATVRDFYTNAQAMEIAIAYYRQINTAIARERLQAIANDTRLTQAIRDLANQALQ